MNAFGDVEGERSNVERVGESSVDAKEIKHLRTGESAGSGEADVE